MNGSGCGLGLEKGTASPCGVNSLEGITSVGVCLEPVHTFIPTISYLK